LGFDCVGIGCSALDYLGIVPRWPEVDEKIAMDDLTIQGGGLIATAMVTLARLGARVSMMWKQGDDSFGQEILRQLEAEGVDHSRVVIEPGARSHFAFCVVDERSGKRTIFFARGTESPFLPEELDRELVQSARCLLIDTHYPLASAAAARWAHDAGVPVVIDCEKAADVGRQEILRYCSHIIPSRAFAQAFAGTSDFGEAARRIFEAFKPQAVVVTLGEEGCMGYDGDALIHQPVFPVEVVDTTGAGDVFHGAYAYGLLQGWPLAEIMRFASAVAALKCRRLGGRAGIPTLAETMAFLQRHP
jgi:sulfofructose kinase